MHCVCQWLLCSDELGFGGYAHVCLHFSVPFAEDFGIVKWGWRWQGRGDLLAEAFEYYLENNLLKQPLAQSSFVMLSKSHKPECWSGCSLTCFALCWDGQALAGVAAWAAALPAIRSLLELKLLQWFCKAASHTCAAQIPQKCALNMAHSASKFSESHIAEH